MKYFGGVDAGSTQTKAILIDETGKVVGRALLDMETSMITVADDAFKAALADAGINREDVVRVAGTGYGRYNVSFGDEQATVREKLKRRGLVEADDYDLVLKTRRGLSEDGPDEEEEGRQNQMPEQ